MAVVSRITKLYTTERTTTTKTHDSMRTQTVLNKAAKNTDINNAHCNYGNSLYHEI